MIRMNLYWESLCNTCKKLEKGKDWAMIWVNKNCWFIPNPKSPRSSKGGKTLNLFMNVEGEKIEVCMCKQRIHGD